MSINPASQPYTLQPSQPPVSPPTLGIPELAARILDCESECTLWAKGSGAGPISVPIPWQCELIDMIVHSQGVHASGTVQAKNGANVVTDAVVAAAASTVIHCATIDPAYSKFTPGGTLSLVLVSTPDVRVAMIFKRYQSTAQTNPDGS